MSHGTETPAPKIALPWYREGLRFACTQCGNCCSGEGHVWLSADDLERLAAGMSLEPAEFAGRFVRRVDGRLALLDKGPHKDCVFLRPDRRCEVYEHRPTQCRTWPFWRENLVGARTWKEVSARCPGVDRGRLHGPAEIERIVRQDEAAEAAG